ncbi:phosphatase PAP2 family protein [Porphyromonas sp.]|uniref:phosphatase PAP2 family protein n=1 Tax=Porphyromonas sp. TaxID=1924944 RepID=UPI0026DB056D|nr:phosphatase PAP2 family protein [Porphyromonas sp.]MDO4695809.1 phosphatase PAP2 family protein [Porphyromonas sp.]MDO4771409.1 phosphatase PAP2 family protein [Porphyromonas sp.]
MIENLVLIEKEIFLLLNSPHTYYLDSVMYLISDKLPWIPYGVLFFVMLFYRQKPKEILWVLFAIALLIFLGDQLSSHIFKPFFQRYRPTHHPETMEIVKTVLDYRGGSYGFISGHSTNFFSVATFTVLLFRNRLYTITAYIVVTTVAYSRIYLGVHFITDVIPGICVGILLGWLIYQLYIYGRQSLLKISPSQVKNPFVQPKQRIDKIAISLGCFYILLWILSPLVFKWSFL